MMMMMMVVVVVVYVAVPVFRDRGRLPRNMNLTAGDSVSVRCDAYAKPRANITWIKNAQPLDRQFTSLRTYHTVTLTVGYIERQRARLVLGWVTV